MTLLSEDRVAEVTLLSLIASGVVPTTDGVGVPRTDRIPGVEADKVDTRLLADWTGDASIAGEAEGSNI